MCTLFLAYKTHPLYDLILIGNRDEFLDRPTEKAHLWAEYPGLFAGRDLKAGGTWMGISGNGRFATLTNYRDPNDIRPDALSRGDLVKDFLVEESTPLEYLEKIQSQSTLYNGFNLLVGTKDSLGYFSNKQNQIQLLPPGVYGLSNRFLDTPWPKVAENKILFRQLTETEGEFSKEAAFHLLTHSGTYEAERLPNTGVPPEWEKKLSALFIQIPPTYGTRLSTVILMKKNGEIEMEERTYFDGKEWKMDAPETAFIQFLEGKVKYPSS